MPYRTIRPLLCTILFVWLTGFFPGFRGVDKASASEPGTPSFSLYILKTGFDELHLGYHPEKSWEILKKIDLGNSALVLTESDVESYHGTTRTLVLTAKGTGRFAGALSGQRLDHRAFVVALDGQRRYGGLFLSRHSAMAINYPVIYLEQPLGENLRLQIRPAHGINASLDPSRLKGIHSEELSLLFERQGKLKP